MGKLRDKFIYSDFHRVFNWKDEFSRGRSFLLINTLVMNIANVFVAGAFQTAFLVNNGIDIV